MLKYLYLLNFQEYSDNDDRQFFYRDFLNKKGLLNICAKLKYKLHLGLLKQLELITLNSQNAPELFKLSQFSNLFSQNIRHFHNNHLSSEVIGPVRHLDGEEGEDGVVRFGSTHNEVSEDVVEKEVED